MKNSYVMIFLKLTQKSLPVYRKFTGLFSSKIFPLFPKKNRMPEYSP
jgi:hypothetical protein